MDKFSIFKLLNTLSSFLAEQPNAVTPKKEEPASQKKEENSFAKAYIKSVQNHRDFVNRVQNKK